MRQSRRTVGVAVAVVVLVGAGAYVVFNAGEDEPAPASPADTAGAEQAAAAFLAAWAAGDTEAAAARTDDPAAGRAGLTAFAAGAGVTGLELTPGAGTAGDAGVTVPFTVRAEVAHGELSADWSYSSELTVLPADGDAEPLVDWTAGLPHPELADGATLEIGPGDGTSHVRVLDSAGAELTAEDHPGLAGLLTQLSERYAEESGASLGVELRLRGGDGDDGSGDDGGGLLTLAEPADGEVPTTIDRDLQRAAEQALADAPRAAMVAVEPSSGAIRAVVNIPPDGDDLAFNGRNSPGSTWKIVTAGMLLDEGLATPDAAHPCPKFFDHGGWEFHNLDEFEIKNGTFTQAFAASCNTAFISTAPKLDDGQLGDYARKTFGVGLEWETGVPALSGSVPVESDAQLAAQLIGQAGVLVNPLVMASVSATVKEGAFHQPYLVEPEFDGRELATADGPSAKTAEQLRKLMRATATGGTAAEAMAGLTGDIGGKTGSAEVFDQKKPNAWFTAFRDDLAVAAVVPDSGHGGKFAGPLVAEVLRSAG
jgi:hypothetical protein